MVKVIIFSNGVQVGAAGGRDEHRAIFNAVNKWRGRLSHIQPDFREGVQWDGVTYNVRQHDGQGLYPVVATVKAQTV